MLQQYSGAFVLGQDTPDILVVRVTFALGGMVDPRDHELYLVICNNMVCTPADQPRA